MDEQLRFGSSAFDRARRQRRLMEALAPGAREPGMYEALYDDRAGTYSSSSVTSSPRRFRPLPQSVHRFSALSLVDDRALDEGLGGHERERRAD